MSPQTLTPKQQRFCHEYLIDCNATQAAIRAGYAAATAKKNGASMLRNVQVAEYIQAKQEALAQQLDISAQKVLQEYASIAFFNIRSLFTTDNCLIPVNELDVATTAAIASIEVYEKYSGTGDERTHIGNTIKIKLHNKLVALEGLARHLGLFDKDNAQRQGPVDVVVMIGDEIISG